MNISNIQPLVGVYLFKNEQSDVILNFCGYIHFTIIDFWNDEVKRVELTE